MMANFAVTWNTKKEVYQGGGDTLHWQTDGFCHYNKIRLRFSSPIGNDFRHKTNCSAAGRGQETVDVTQNNTHVRIQTVFRACANLNNI